MELSEPLIRPPSKNVGEQRYRKRYNPETGNITGGEGTWVIIADRPEEDLLDILEDAIDIYDPLPRYAEAARLQTRRLKRNPEGPHDVMILSEVLPILRQEVDLEEDLGFTQFQ